MVLFKKWTSQIPGELDTPNRSPQGFAPPQLLASQRVVDRSAPMAAKALPDEPRFLKTRWFPIFPLNPGWIFWGGCFFDGLS